MTNIVRREQVVAIPNPFSLMLYLQEEIKQMRPDNENNTAFHYTDLSGFISIIQNRELWMSNVSFINDRNEMQDGISICQKMIRDYLNGDLTCNQKNGLEIIWSKLDKGISGGSWDSNKFDMFASCFCMEGDLLTQWRGYGENGGIAIGFDQRQLRQCCRLMASNLYNEEIRNGTEPERMLPHNEMTPLLKKVIYDDTEKEIIIKIILDLCLESLDYQNDDALLEWVCSEFTDIIFRYMPLFKNSSFFSEQELRYVFSAETSKTMRIAAAPLRRTQIIDFRTRNGLILPFIKFKLLDVNCRPLRSLPIKKIVIGPCLHNEDLLESVKYFLENTNNSELIDRVISSDVPFRG